MKKEVIELAIRIIVENPQSSLKISAAILKAAANHADEIGEIVVSQILKKFKSE